MSDEWKFHNGKQIFYENHSFKKTFNFEYLVGIFLILGMPTIFGVWLIDDNNFDLKSKVFILGYWVMLFLIYKAKHPQKFN